MKKELYTLITFASLFALGGCNELEPADVDFSVTADKTTVAVGEPVTFTFDGNPHFITLYSGEEGHEYVNRNRTEVSLAEIKSTSLSFSSKMQYGTQMDAFRVYLSNDFPGLTKKDTLADAKLIQEHPWKNITEQCNILYNSKDNSSGPIDLSEYQSGMTLAFQFIGNTQSTPQRTLTITNLLIVNELKNGQKTSKQSADLGFTCFDVVPSNPEKNSYKYIVSGTALKGSWSLLNMLKANQLQFQGGSTADELFKDNNDWLISDVLKLNGCMPDTGETLKNISRKLSSYAHTFKAKGIYTVTILAGNVNIEGEKTMLKEFTIEVN